MIIYECPVCKTRDVEILVVNNEVGYRICKCNEQACKVTFEFLIDEVKTEEIK